MAVDQNIGGTPHGKRGRRGRGKKKTQGGASETPRLPTVKQPNSGFDGFDTGLPSHEYSTNKLHSKAKKEEELRVLERMMRNSSTGPAAAWPTPRSFTSAYAAMGESPRYSPGGAVNQFISTGGEEEEMKVEEISPLTSRSGPLSAIGSKNHTSTSRTRFPIIAGPGERQRFITTFLDGRLNHEMVAVEKASVRAQELAAIQAPSGMPRLSVVEEAVAILTCFTKDEDTLSTAYLIDLVRFEKLTLESAHAEFGPRTGGMLEKMLLMENQPQLFTSQIELLCNPLHISPVESWVMIVLAFVLVEMFQQECIQLEWVEQVIMTLGHHQGLLTSYTQSDEKSPEAVVVGLLLLGSDVVQETVAFRGHHLQDMKDVLKRLQIRRLPCCDGLVRHGLNSLVLAYEGAREVICSQPGETSLPPGAEKLQDLRIHAQSGIGSSNALAEARTVAAIAAIGGSEKARQIVHLLRIDAEQTTPEYVEQYVGAELATLASEVTMSVNDFTSSDEKKISTLAQGMTKEMGSDALLATLADVYQGLVDAGETSPAALRDYVRDVVQVFALLSTSKWDLVHATIVSAISDEIELSVGT